MSVLTGLTQVASPVLDFAGSLIQNSQNKQLQQQQYNNELKMWNAQNAYNTPAAQMQRFRDAGLNPNLIYSQGNPGNSSAAPTAAPAHMENMFSGASSKMMQSLQNYQDWQVKKAQIDNVKAQTDLTTQSARNAAVDNALKQVQVAQNQFNYSQSKKLGQNQLDMASQALRQATINANLALQAYNFNDQNNVLKLINQKYSNDVAHNNVINTQIQSGILSQQQRSLQINNAKNQLQLDMDRQLKPWNLNDTDNSFVRFGVGILHRIAPGAGNYIFNKNR